ncbi:MAG: glycerol-3-phosphate 1-O-acyltransferase [Ilumatobacteraceae bacterium]
MDRVVVVAQAATATEARLLSDWVATSYPKKRPVTVVVVPRPRRSDDDLGQALAAFVDVDDDPQLVPIRIAWLPKDRAGDRSARWTDLVLVGDPRRPRRIAQPWLRRWAPDRALVVEAEPARLSVLRDAWLEHDADHTPGGFARFVGRRAALALERAESHLLGPHYKVPRLVREDIVASSRFSAGVERLATDLDRSRADVDAHARACLDEMATGYGTLQIDVNAQLGRFMYRRAYERELDVDHSQVARVRVALRDHAGVVLPTHRSNLDAGVMPAAMRELGLPKTHTLAGINMAFWPLAPIMRRAGVIYIRRETKDDPIYRWVLREYVGYLVEKRFHLEWYIEGGRSRTGKLLPPKLGLLTYVADAYLEGRTDDVVLVPASITYDQLREVEDYAGEARGATKQAETAASFVRYGRSLRGRFGTIYIRFGEPVSLRAALGPPRHPGDDPGDDRRLALTKLGLEVSRRINDVTPITAASLITMALLGAGGRALTSGQLDAALDRYVTFAEDRDFPLTASARGLRRSAVRRSALDGLVRQGVVARADDGREPVFLIGPDQHLAAAFYRNATLHRFLDASIVELSIVAASAVPPAERVARFWDAAFEIRALLTFDFFFLERQPFRQRIDEEVRRRDAQWEQSIVDGDPLDLLRRIEPIVIAHTALRSFVEAYFVVARTIMWVGPDAAADRDALLVSCAGLGHQYLLQQRISSVEAVNRLLFGTGLQLAAHVGALDPTRPDAARDLADRLRQVLRGLDVVERIAHARFQEVVRRRAEVRDA